MSCISFCGVCLWIGGGVEREQVYRTESCLLCTHELIPLWDFTYLV